MVIVSIGVFYLSTKIDEKQFLYLDDSFVYLRDVLKYYQSTDSSPWKSYTKIYGTNKNVKETREYFYQLATLNWLEKILTNIPGFNLLIYKKIAEFGDIEKEHGMLLEIQYSWQNQARITLSSPAIHTKNFPYITEVYITYNISRKDYFIKYLAILFGLFLTGGFILYLGGRSLCQSARDFK